MNKHLSPLVLLPLAMAVVTPTLAQTATPVAGASGGAPNATASIPNFTGSWNHPAFPWFEPPASGPGPVTNRSRGPQRPGGAGRLGGIASGSRRA